MKSAGRTALRPGCLGKDEETGHLPIGPVDHKGKTMNRFILTVAFLLAMLPLAVAQTGKAKTYDSPKAAFDAAVAASKKQDWKTFVGCMDSQSIDVLVVDASMQMIRIKNPNNKQKDKENVKAAIKAIDDMLLRHNLKNDYLTNLEKVLKEKPPKDMKDRLKKMVEWAKPVKDKVGFVVDAILAFDKAEKMKEGPLTTTKLSNVKITGNTAKGTLTRKFGEEFYTQEVIFTREGGSWKMGLPSGQAQKIEAKKGPVIEKKDK